MNNVHVVLYALKIRLSVCVHAYISCRYDCIFVFAMFFIGSQYPPTSACVDYLRNLNM